MDVGTVFLLGLVAGQWLMLYAVWRALTQLVALLSDLQAGQEEPGRVKVIDYHAEKDDDPLIGRERK